MRKPSRVVLYDPNYDGAYLVIVTRAGAGRRLYARCPAPDAWDTACVLQEAAIKRGYTDARIVRETDFTETQETDRRSAPRAARAA